MINMASLLPVLTFHDIDERTSVISISPGVFQHGICKLYERKYHALSLMEAVDFIGRGAPFPDRSSVMTFDDGYLSVHKETFSVLQRYDWSATIFISVGETGTMKSRIRLPSLGERPMLSWHEILEMHRAGITFGAHTCTHPDLTSLHFDRVKAEICGAKVIIEDVLSTSVACFAYPYGRYDRQIRKIVQQNFSCACSDKLGLITKGSDLYALERVDVYYLRTDRLFNTMPTRLFPWYVRARNIPRRIRRAFHPSSRG